MNLMRLHPNAGDPGLLERAMEAVSRVAAAIIYGCMVAMARGRA